MKIKESEVRQTVKQISLDKLKRNPITKYIIENLGLLVAFFVMCMIITVIVPDKFLTKNNIINILRQISTNAIIAFGMTFAIVTAGIDLSVGSVVALSGTFCAGFIESGVPYVAAILLGLIIGTACGVFCGYVISRTAIPPFIVTLAMMQMARGCSYIYSGGRPIRTPDAFGIIGNGYVFGIPIPVIIMITLLIIMSLILSKSTFGRFVYAIGGNKEAAKFSGINTANVIWIVYILVGLMASISGIITASRLYSGQPTVAQGGEMDAISATVLGGVSMSGGSGKIGGVILGALIIGVLSNGMNLLKVPSFYQLIVQGAIILLAVYVDVKRKGIQV